MSDIKNYENLANAIVIQAAKDYRKALRKYKRQPENKAVKSEIREIERFFRSNWYRTLTVLDGEMLIKRLREGLIL